MKKPHDLTIAEVAKAIKFPVKKWPGNCYAVACKIVDAGLVKGRAVYGVYKGPVAETGYWANRRTQGLIRHGWIILQDGSKRVFDPTRWSFEDLEPYFFISRRDKDYDEGANELRAAMMKPCPVYRKPSKNADQFEKNRLKHITLDVSDVSREFLMDLTNHPTAFTWEIVHWISNLPPKTFGIAAKEIFQAIVAAGQGILYPDRQPGDGSRREGVGDASRIPRRDDQGDQGRWL